VPGTGMAANEVDLGLLPSAARWPIGSSSACLTAESSGIIRLDRGVLDQIAPLERVAVTNPEQDGKAPSWPGVGPRLSPL
jgi:hypothetical protein